MKKRILTSAVAAALLVTGCISEQQQHVGSSDDAYFESISDSFRGIQGVMPTIGKIYIDNVTVDTANDGTLTDMRKAALNYVLSADLIVDDYSILNGPNAKCNWSTAALGTSFQSDTEGKVTVGPDGKTATSPLTLNSVSGSYECTPVKVYFTKTGNEQNYDPDSVVSVSFTDKDGNDIKRIGYDIKYTTGISLNTADRHNIINVATSPSSVLYYRTDGLFQAGFTAYRGLKGLQKYIGSATYEAYVQAPGATNKVEDNGTQQNFDTNITADKSRMAKWLDGTGTTADGIHSDSAFVSSYGPPIALPPVRDNLTEADYRKFRTVLMRHNNNPIVITNDKKLYTMGSVSNFIRDDTTLLYPYFIRSNDNWFQYSGVDISSDSDITKLHVGEIKIADGTPAKFVSTLSVTSDLGTIISLNEYDKEYYITGSPFYNEGFCEQQATFNYDTYSFNFNFPCNYNSSKRVGAVKMPGLQKLIGDGEGVVATDSHIYYTGNDGKVYQIDILPEAPNLPGSDMNNYRRIKSGLDIIPQLVVLDDVIDSPITDKTERDKLYAVDMGLPNMNPVLSPTFLMNDGSIVFTFRQFDNVTNQISYTRKHFYISSDTSVEPGTSKPGDLYNIPITNLLGPTVGYGADGKLYYFTDVPALGITYAPTASGADDEFLAFVNSDPVQQLSAVKDKENFFKFKFGELNIEAALDKVSTADNTLGNNFVLLPYNPYTDAVQDYTVEDNGSITFSSEQYRPFRTNAHLFVNLNAGAKYNYILVPYYFYGFNYDSPDQVNVSSWKIRDNALLAAEVRNNDVSKVFGAFSNPNIPFKYTPYGRNTALFANKKGIFSFVDYNVRKTEIMCQEETSDRPTACASVTTLGNKNVPDYFYRGKSGNRSEESSGRNNFISTPFVQENRMSNFPDNTNYTTKGFEPQLLSSWFYYELALPNTLTGKTSSAATLAGYIPQYFFEAMKGRSGTGITFADDATNVTTWLDGMYQFAYGAGLYHYYGLYAYPVWRARKFGTEILQYQARFGTLLPMTHGATADYLFSNLPAYFKEGPAVAPNSTETVDKDAYVTPRIYTHAHYAFYDKDQLANEGRIQDVILGGVDIENTSIGDALATANTSGSSNGSGSGLGYIMDKGNFMWRAGTPAADANSGKPVSATLPLNDRSYFSNFVSYHN